MGGRGSGRQSSFSSKPETNESMPLDIRKITRKGLLRTGMSFSWQWLVNDLPVAGISIKVVFDQGMVLSWRVRRTGEVVEQRVQTQTSPCHMGGNRHWFTCSIRPRVAVYVRGGQVSDWEESQVLLAVSELSAALQ